MSDEYLWMNESIFSIMKTTPELKRAFDEYQRMQDLQCKTGYLHRCWLTKEEAKILWQEQIKKKFYGNDMSSTLYIEPVNRQKGTLSSTLKFALKRRFPQETIQRVFDSSDLSYFQGLFDAGIEDAKIVIDMIEKYEEVTIQEVY